jgi:crossover junction endodeoxyribonuclease RuvC
MTVLGIDPGLGTMGWAVIAGSAEHPKLLTSGTIRTRPKDDLSIRLLTICDGVRELVSEHQVELVAIEEVFFAKDPKAAMALGQAHGAAVIAAAMTKTPVHPFAARVVKQSVTGNGRATKEQVAFMVQSLLGLSAPLSPLDTSDAAAIALCCMNRNVISEVAVR